ncbi:MAG: hypothetical protein KTV68_10195 [Acidimicrobiia bacterium]|nr:hypothetical protein [Acidimicrobiia bacterium]MCY4432524.1 hypothetical protein [bacterium]
MDGGDDQLRVVLRHVVPIEQYTIRITEAHGLGCGPGGHTDIWCLEFQRRAQKVWKETLPSLFQRQVADSYERCVQLMGLVSPNESITGDWESVARYLGAVADAINNDPDCAEQGVASESYGIGQMPEVIHYERLAELMHPDAVEKLCATAAAVAHYCRSSLSIVPDEIQLACLQGLANGEKHADLAKRLGYSERHFQRILADMWHQFGVGNTTEGVAFAVQNDWVAVPNPDR